VSTRAATVPARELAARAWRFRCGVEREASLRFARLAGWLEEVGYPARLVGLAERASSDERRHARRCAALTESLGARVDAPPAGPPPTLAPAALSGRAAVLYEAVAACCVTETGSVGVLTTLLGAVRGGRLRRTLRELAADEVGHSRLGWAVLATERDPGVLDAVAPFVPAMLSGSVDPGLFLPGTPAEEDGALLELGVLPRSLQREVFVRTTREVVLPGLAECGIDPAAARRWLEARLREAGVQDVDAQ
jgi:hypothetical protein